MGQMRRSIERIYSIVDTTDEKGTLSDNFLFDCILKILVKD